MGAVEGACQQVDLRFQYVDAFEQARGAVFQMLLQYKTIDELDLASLHDLETARRAQIDELPPIDDLHEIQIQEGIVEVPAKILKPEDRLVLDELRLVEIGTLRWKRQGLFEEKVPDLSQLRRKLGHIRCSQCKSFGPNTLAAVAPAGLRTC